MRKTQIVLFTILAAFLIVTQNANALSKSRAAVSPYVQTDVDSTYTFVGITHPSLNTADTNIGLLVETVDLTGTNPSTSFTINAGETKRIFIVSTNHSTINSDTVTTSDVIFLSVTSGSSTFGALHMTALFADAFNGTSVVASPSKYRNLNQLAMWGAIVIPSTSTGFAMEFVGDAHDSTLFFTTISEDGAISVVGDGRGIN